MMIREIEDLGLRKKVPMWQESVIKFLNIMPFSDGHHNYNTYELHPYLNELTSPNPSRIISGSSLIREMTLDGLPGIGPTSITASSRLP